MSLTLIQIVLILAPILLGASIVAYWRLRRHVSNTQKPVVVFLQKRWDVLLIVTGGIVLFRGAAISDGVGFVPQLFGFLLSLEFFYIGYATIRVTMSARGLLMGMRYMPWQRFFEIFVAHRAGFGTHFSTKKLSVSRARTGEGRCTENFGFRYYKIREGRGRGP